LANRNFNGIERSIVQANLERYVQAKVTNMADAIGRVLLMTESGARLVTFQPAPHQITGSRLPELLQKQYVIESGKRPEFIDELETIQQAKKIA